MENKQNSDCSKNDYVHKHEQMDSRPYPLQNPEKHSSDKILDQRASNEASTLPHLKVSISVGKLSISNSEHSLQESSEHVIDSSIEIQCSEISDTLNSSCKNGSSFSSKEETGNISTKKRKQLQESYLKFPRNKKTRKYISVHATSNSPECIYKSVKNIMENKGVDEKLHMSECSTTVCVSNSRSRKASKQGNIHSYPKNCEVNSSSAKYDPMTSTVTHHKYIKCDSSTAKIKRNCKNKPSSTNSKTVCTREDKNVFIPDKDIPMDACKKNKIISGNSENTSDNLRRINAQFPSINIPEDTSGYQPFSYWYTHANLFHQPRSVFIDTLDFKSSNPQAPIIDTSLNASSNQLFSHWPNCASSFHQYRSDLDVVNRYVGSSIYPEPNYQFLNTSENPSSSQYMQSHIYPLIYQQQLPNISGGESYSNVFCYDRLSSNYSTAPVSISSSLNYQVNPLVQLYTYYMLLPQRHGTFQHFSNTSFSLDSINADYNNNSEIYYIPVHTLETYNSPEINWGFNSQPFTEQFITYPFYPFSYDKKLETTKETGAACKEIDEHSEISRNKDMFETVPDSEYLTPTIHLKTCMKDRVKRYHSYGKGNDREQHAEKSDLLKAESPCSQPKLEFGNNHQPQSQFHIEKLKKENTNMELQESHGPKELNNSKDNNLFRSGSSPVVPVTAYSHHSGVQELNSAQKDDRRLLRHQNANDGKRVVQQDQSRDVPDYEHLKSSKGAIRRTKKERNKNCNAARRKRACKCSNPCKGHHFGDYNSHDGTCKYFESSEGYDKFVESPGYQRSACTAIARPTAYEPKNTVNDKGIGQKVNTSHCPCSISDNFGKGKHTEETERNQQVTRRNNETKREQGAFMESKAGRDSCTTPPSSHLSNVFHVVEGTLLTLQEQFENLRLLAEDEKLRMPEEGGGDCDFKKIIDEGVSVTK